MAARMNRSNKLKGLIIRQTELGDVQQRRVRHDGRGRRDRVLHLLRCSNSDKGPNDAVDVRERDVQLLTAATALAYRVSRTKLESRMGGLVSQ